MPNDFSQDANCVGLWNWEWNQHWMDHRMPDGAATGLTITTSAWNSRAPFPQIWRDFGENHFGGDFEFRCQYLLSVNTAYIWDYIWNLTNIQADPTTIINASGDYAAVHHYRPSPGGIRLYITLCEAGVTKSSPHVTISPGTQYYLTFNRDDDGGADGTGQYTLRVYTGNYYGESGASEVATVTVDSSAGEQNDFRYMYCYTGNGNGGSGAVTSVHSDYQIDGESMSPDFDYRWPVREEDSISGTVYNYGPALPSDSDVRVGSYSLFLSGSEQFLQYPDGQLPSDFPFDSGAGDYTTVACWFKLYDVPSSTGDNMFLCGRWAYLTSQRQYKIYIGTDDKVHIAAYGTTQQGDKYLDHTLVADRWYHLAFVYNNPTDEITLRLYDTGDTTVYSTTQTIFGSGTINPQGSSFYIGGFYYSVGPVYSEEFYGVIDELVVFKDMLTDDEIDEIRQGIFGPQPEPPAPTGADTLWLGIHF